MMLLPGSFSGRASSPRPHLGGRCRGRRTSLAIWKQETARVRIALLAATSAFVSGQRGELVRRGAKRRAGESGDLVRDQLGPLGMGVESRSDRGPASSASSWRPSSVRSSAPSQNASCAAQPLNSCPSVSGVASIRWVRPTLTMSLNASLLASMPFRRAATAGKRRSLISRAAATCITVGKTSFDDCERLTSSFG